MKLQRPFKELFIRLAENDQLFVCTVQYGGFFRKSVKYPVSVEPETLPSRDDGFSRAPRRDFSTKEQEER